MVQKTMRWVRGAVAAVALVGAGCQSRDAGTGGSGEELEYQQGGSGDVGQNEGVLNDNEGAFEDNQGVFQGDSQIGDGKVGEKEGVLNDGEGPVENIGGAGEGDNQMGQEPGVLNDGEGPVEQNENLNREPDTGATQNE